MERMCGILDLKGFDVLMVKLDRLFCFEIIHRGIVCGINCAWKMRSKRQLLAYKC